MDKPVTVPAGATKPEEHQAESAHTSSSFSSIGEASGARLIEQIEAYVSKHDDWCYHNEPACSHRDIALLREAAAQLTTLHQPPVIQGEHAERLAEIQELLRAHGPQVRKMLREPATARRLDVQLFDAATFLLAQLTTLQAANEELRKTIMRDGSMTMTLDEAREEEAFLAAVRASQLEPERLYELVRQGTMEVATSDPARIKALGEGKVCGSAIEDLRELEAAHEADRPVDTAWAADVARRAIAHLTTLQAERSTTGKCPFGCVDGVLTYDQPTVGTQATCPCPHPSHGISVTTLQAEQDASGVGLIATERARQVSAEGWTPQHDDEHRNGEMAVSAARYALHDTAIANRIAWQWESCWWKPKDPIRNLVRAGALIAAEIDRRLRALPSPPRQAEQDAGKTTKPMRDGTGVEGSSGEATASSDKGNA